ncbi:MAG: PEGA domain-containing protein [Deltaproteobacteria bacterium]|nr:PEGA domain-containing protein [Deltaproteobacteria bacterium]
MIWMCIALAFMVNVAHESRARADGGILFVGKVEPREREVIRATIVDTARRFGWTVTEKTFNEKDNEEVLACLRIDRPYVCARRVLKANDIDRLAVVDVGVTRGSDGKPLVVVTQQVIVPGAEVAFIGRRTCEQCDEAGLRHHVATLTTKLIEDAATGSHKTMLQVTSDPPGAWITLDGANAGSTNATIPTHPGKHTVMLRAPGYETEVRDVDAAEGRVAQVNVTMRRHHDTRRGGGGRGVLPWLLVGGGVGLVVGGGALVALAEDPVPGVPQSPTLRTTTTRGVVGIAAGVAVGGVGAYLLLRPKKRTSIPTVSIDRHGATVGWCRAF